MHFRHIMIMVFLIVAAMFLPKNAFAAKLGPGEQPASQNTTAQPYVSETTVNSKAAVKAKEVTTKPINNSQAGVVQHPVTNTTSPKTGTAKQETNSFTMPAQNNNKVHSSSGENVKVSTMGASAAKENPMISTGSAKTNPVTNKTGDNSGSLPDAESKVDKKIQSSSLHTKSKTLKEGSHSSISIKTDLSNTMEQKQPINGESEQNNPLNNKKVPGIIDIVNNPPQRTPSTGGQSNDQLNTGTGAISFIANWFAWDEFFGFHLKQIYYSRQAKYCHQWMNAPPSPPPQTAPFFLTFTADISHR